MEYIEYISKMQQELAMVRRGQNGCFLCLHIFKQETLWKQDPSMYIASLIIRYSDLLYTRECLFINTTEEVGYGFVVKVQ